MSIKTILFLVCSLVLVCPTVHAQKPETFDMLTYVMPKGWQKDEGSIMVQMGIDGEKGACLIMLFKSLPGGANSKENFTAAWDTLVKEMVKVTSKPEMKPATNVNGWTMETGSTPYEVDGKKGTVQLVTVTGGSKLVNILIVSDTNAYQSEITAFLKSIKLPNLAGGTEVKPEAGNKPAVAPTPRKSNFKFGTTNFDDGWTATEQDDWVRVTKGDIAVLVHYPNEKADAYNSVLRDGLQNAWNILVAHRYTNIRNFELKPIQSFESIAFAEADAEEKATGKNVHIVLFKKHFNQGTGKYIEFVTGSKGEFEKEFGAYRSDEFGWDKLVNMQFKNRFAVSGADLPGKWTTSNFASLAYYYVNTGGFAGATSTSTADSFTFNPGGTYQSEHSGASGQVGNAKFSNQNYKGKFTAKEWTLTLTNRFQGDSETYNCHFEAVKGGRILVLTDKHNTVLSLVKQK